MLDKIVQFLDKILQKLSPDYVLYGALGLVVLVFLAFVFLRTYSRRFIRAVKSVVEDKNIKAAEFEERIKKFPANIRAEWDSFRKSKNGNIIEYINRGVCVDVPLTGDAGHAFGIFTSIIALLAFTSNVAMTAGEVFTTANLVTPLVVLVLGLLLTMLLYIISRARYNAALRSYYAFSLFLNRKFPRLPLIGLPSSAQEFDDTAEHYSDEAHSKKPPRRQSSDNITFSSSKEVVFGERGQRPRRAEPREVEEEEGSEDTIVVSEQEYRAEEKAKRTPPKTAEREQSSAASEPKSEHKSHEPVSEEPKIEPKPEPAPEPAPEPKTEFKKEERFEAPPKEEDIVDRIERVTSEGASKQTMHELAKLLQAERSKPENKAPEQQKRLSNAASKLLKAISGAK